MLIAYAVVTGLTAIANIYAAYQDFTRDPAVMTVMRRKQVPESWAVPLGAIKVAGAAGLLIGFAVPPLGTAAALGLVLFFLSAIGAHLRVRSYSLGWPALFLGMSAAAAWASLARHGLV